ncbi:MAG: RluA family pseudouridine synthase [Alphaproteobacteria bacterium]|nr:RluA family pseudouridine synthase [Alphaproteobacteria bacterium]
MAELITVSSVEDGTRLLRWFLRHFPSMPQREFYRLCHGGQIRLNSKRCKGTEILREGDAVRIPPTIREYTVAPKKKDETGEQFSLSDLEQLRLSIIHNDDDIVVFNKPAGLAVQGGTGIRKSIDKMAAALFPYAKVSLVHRLDMETSGLLVVAKTQHAAQVLSREFQTKNAHKEYLALLNGDIREDRGVIDNYLLKGRVFDSPARENGTGARPHHAITEYRVLARASGMLTWVLFMPHTGRTHQLRMHSAFSLNAPIIGDDLYGRGHDMDIGLRSVLNTNNLFLFAYKITFQHPSTGRMVTFRAPIPEFMKPVMNLLELPLP